MSCETCGTIERYGKRVYAGRRLCLDCWKDKKKEQKKSKAKESKNSKGED
jgi:hypothetical protein